MHLPAAVQVASSRLRHQLNNTRPGVQWVFRQGERVVWGRSRRHVAASKPAWQHPGWLVWVWGVVSRAEDCRRVDEGGGRVGAGRVCVCVHSVLGSRGVAVAAGGVGSELERRAVCKNRRRMLAAGVSEGEVQ
jgi:hypothetical protein